MAPSRDTTAAHPRRRSVHFQTHDDAYMADTLQRQVSQGSPCACLSLGDLTFAAAMQRNRSSSSSRSSNHPRARSHSSANDNDDNATSLFARAASVYITGIVWAFSVSSPVLAHRHSPSSTIPASTSGRGGKTPTTSPGSSGLPAQPATRDYALICNLLRNLTFVLQKAPFHRRRHHLSSTTLVLPEMQAGLHQATLHDTLGVLGWTAPTEMEAPPSVVTIPTIAYRLSKQFLPALLHAEDEFMQSTSASVVGVRGEENSGALISLLGDLSSAAAMAHNARGQSSSSSITEPDSAAEESNSNSSYPTSPETHLRSLDLSHDHDNDESNEEILNDSPPTTPSQTSSSDDLSKTFPSRPTHQHHQHVAFRDILQERLGGIDTKMNSVGFPRSNTIDTISSGVSSPVSRRSRASSIRSTASSIFERMCGQPKTKTTVSLHAEPQSTMGSFTPVSAKTASTSLRRFGVPTTNGKNWGTRMKSRLGVPQEFWDSDTGVESDSAAATPSKPIARRHARSATTVEIPAISMTHASFRPESMLDAALTTSPTSPVAPRSPTRPPTRSQTVPQPRASPPRSRTSSKVSPPIPSISSVLAPRSQIPQRSQTDPISGPTRGLPKLDPTLAALEKGCRLKAKVSCAHCGKVGWDFPKNRQGQALCTRECRVAFKAQSEGKGKGREGAAVVSVGA